MFVEHSRVPGILVDRTRNSMVALRQYNAYPFLKQKAFFSPSNTRGHHMFDIFSMFSPFGKTFLAIAAALIFLTLIIGRCLQKSLPDESREQIARLVYVLINDTGFVATEVDDLTTLGRKILSEYSSEGSVPASDEARKIIANHPRFIRAINNRWTIMRIQELWNRANSGQFTIDGQIMSAIPPIAAINEWIAVL